MKGTCLIWSRGRHFSPSLTERGPTGIWHLALSISDPRAEISGTLVMVRRSSSFCACANLPNWNVYHNQEKRCTESNRGDGKLIPRATVEQFSVQVTSWKWEVARLIKQWREYRWFISFPFFIRVFQAVAFGNLLVYYKYATPTDLIDLLVL